MQYVIHIYYVKNVVDFYNIYSWRSMPASDATVSTFFKTEPSYKIELLFSNDMWNCKYLI